MPTSNTTPRFGHIQSQRAGQDRPRSRLSCHLRGALRTVAWVDAEHPELIASQYRNLVYSRTGANLPEADAVVAAKALLAGSERWLVVFDNAATPESLHPHLPAGNGKILATTRSWAWTTNRDLGCPEGDAGQLVPERTARGRRVRIRLHIYR